MSSKVCNTVSEMSVSGGSVSPVAATVGAGNQALSVDSKPIDDIHVQVKSEPGVDGGNNVPSEEGEAVNIGKEVPLEIGKRYNVKKKYDDSWSVGEVVESRESKDGSKEYFVHFDKFDKRLDEWVSKDRFDLSHIVSGTKKSELIIDVELENDRKVTRHQRRKYDEFHHVPKRYEDMDPLTAALEREHEKLTKVKYIDSLVFGSYLIDTWYYSPYPDEYMKVPRLFVCEYCLKYFRLAATYLTHKPQCEHRQPPGNEIYRRGHISVFEMDGAQHKLYCQCLSLLAKLFLDHKTTFFDVSPFLFYVLTEVDREGCHMVGYFSKEKYSVENNNLACFLVLPPHQRKGYGKFLIQFSYELSKIEARIGSPEKPLSDLGKLSYRSYWSWVLLNALKENNITNIKDLSLRTCMSEEDVVRTLQALNMIRYFRGQHVVNAPPKLVDDTLHSDHYKRPRLHVDLACLRWAGGPAVTVRQRANSASQQGSATTTMPLTSPNTVTTNPPTPTAAPATTATVANTYRKH